MDDGVRHQNLRDFTIQVRNPETQEIIGTGFVVSGKKIVTCAHVVELIGLDLCDLNSMEVGIYFPQANSEEDKARSARVISVFPTNEDDIALLELVGESIPIGVKIAELGKAEESSWHRFRSYGYRRLDGYKAGWAEGDIKDSVEAPDDRKVRAEPIELRSSEINSGMSGAAVLDIDPSRNLVVGIISETYFPDQSTKDRDTAWAVNARVLSLEPLNLYLRDGPCPMRDAPKPKKDLIVQKVARPELNDAWNNAPQAVNENEWIDRESVIDSITKDWADPSRNIVGLIGFGGEGKSALASHWVGSLLSDVWPNTTKPDGVFWWTFSDRPSLDEFFEAALNYVSGGNKVLLQQCPSSNARAHILAAMLTSGRYLFILDGLEIMQNQAGDRYGLLKNDDLSNFLNYFAGPGHNSFCLATSRIQLSNLMEYTTYVHYDVGRLSTADGRKLMRTLGIASGSDKELEKIVDDWAGHALTLNLLSTYLVKCYNGDISQTDKIRMHNLDVSDIAKSHYDHLQRILLNYEEYFTKSEGACIMVLSAFRLPVEENSIPKIFMINTNGCSLTALISRMDCDTFKEIMERLVDYRIIRYDSKKKHYTIHPLIREYYYNQLLKDQNQANEIHRHIMEYYHNIGKEVVEKRSLEDLKPLIESIYHACCAGEYDLAWLIYLNEVNKFPDYLLTDQIGAYETEFSLLKEFFPDKNIYRDPLITDPKLKSLILGRIGFDLMSLGYLKDALSIFNKENEISKGINHWRRLSNGYQNLARLYMHLGELKLASSAARKAKKAANKIKHFRHNKPTDRVKLENDINSMCLLAWASYLRGYDIMANELFKKAELIQLKIDKDTRCLTRFRGIYYADYLLRINKKEDAKRIIKANLRICNTNRELSQISRCHRLLGDLNANEEKHIKAYKHYSFAIRIAREIFRKEILIEALLGRGRWAAYYRHDTSASLIDLKEAMDLAMTSGYRIYEADISICLANLYLVLGDKKTAQEMAHRARQICDETGYIWGENEVNKTFQII